MREHIKYCPRCGGQELDFTSYGSDGNVLCMLCRTHFLVLSVRLDLQPASREPTGEAYERPDGGTDA